MLGTSLKRTQTEKQTSPSPAKKQRVDPQSVAEIPFSCLKIVPLDNKNLNENTFDKSLDLTLKPPFFAIYLGPSRSGKTTTWLNFLKNPELLFKRFHRVHYFIPTWNEDTIYEKNLLTEKTYVYTEFKKEIFEDLISEREKLVEAYKRVHGDEYDVDNILPRTLIIVDDNIGTRALSGHVYNMLDILATRGRKLNISTILTIQYLRGVTSRIVRGNATDLFIFYLPDAEEQKKVLTEFQGSITREDILSMYKSCFQTSQDKWNFFYIQNFNTNVFNKFRKNLNTVLIPPSLLENFKSKYPEWGAKVAGQNHPAKSPGYPPHMKEEQSKHKERLTEQSSELPRVMQKQGLDKNSSYPQNNKKRKNFYKYK